MRAPSITWHDPLLQALLEFFRQQPVPPAPILHPDPGINELIRCTHPASRFRHAAVLIPIACSESGSAILFTLRTEHLSAHAGQVSFPGGTRDNSDISLEHTALRESEEEIGLKPEAVQIIGQLGTLLMPSGYCVTPVIGLFAADTPLQRSPREVAEIFSVPTATALNPASYQRSTMLYQHREREILEFHHQGHRIWGATATILYHLAQRIAPT